MAFFSLLSSQCPGIGLVRPAQCIPVRSPHPNKGQNSSAGGTLVPGPDAKMGGETRRVVSSRVAAREK